MPIAPTEPPEIGDLPEAPSRFTDTPDEFSQKAEDWSDALPPYSDDVEAVADWTNKTASEVFDNATEANQSASDAANSAQAAQASANFIGVWADLTGPVAIGESVYHSDQYWIALIAIADITASEPGVIADWAVAANSKPTTEQLINGNYSSPNGVIETSGYASPGDGGAAHLQKTGVAGLTPSQTFADTQGGTCTDSTGVEFEFVGPIAFAEQFGAFGGDDCTLELQAMASWMIANNTNGYLGVGEYYTDKVDFLNASRVTFSGLGHSSILRLNSGIEDHVIAVSNPLNVTIRDMRIVGDLDALGESVTGHGIRGADCNGLDLRNLIIQDCSFYGIGLQNGPIKDVTIENVRIYRTGSDGIDIKNKADSNDNITLHNIYVEDFGLSDPSSIAGIDLRGRCSVSQVQIAIGATEGVGINCRGTSVETGTGAGGSVINDVYITTTTDINTVGVNVEPDADDVVVNNLNVNGTGFGIKTLSKMSGSNLYFKNNSGDALSIDADGCVFGIVDAVDCGYGLDFEAGASNNIVGPFTVSGSTNRDIRFQSTSINNKIYQTNAQNVENLSRDNLINNRHSNHVDIQEEFGLYGGDDITAAMNVAISRFGNNGGTILLPYAIKDNPCEISSELTIRANLCIKGISKTSSWIKTPDGVNIATFKCTNTSGITFKSFSHDANFRSGLTNGITINVENGSDMQIDDLHVYDLVASPLNVFAGSNNIDIGTISMEGGGLLGSRGVSLSDTDNITIGKVKATDIITGVVTVSNSTNVDIGQIHAKRDTSGGTSWTDGKAALRCTNNSSNVTVGTVNSDGWSRGVFILTGCTDISVGAVGIDNSENYGVWIEGDNGVEKPGAGNVTVSGGYVKNSGLASVRLSDTEGNVISGLTVDGDIEEVNANATSDKNIITSNRVLGAVTTVGASTVAANNVTGI